MVTRSVTPDTCRLMRTLSIPALAALALILTAAPAAATVVDEAISFEVVNQNRSSAPCPTDGRTYRLSATLVAPARALRPGGGRAATLYLHGFGISGATWRPRAVAGYDLAVGLANRGHTSVILDRLSFGGSDVPHGFFACIGGEADVAHQIIDALREGDYATTRRRPVPFKRVALSGHSAGAQIAGLTAMTFGGVDALVSMSFEGGSQAMSPDLLRIAAMSSSVCATGGEAKRPGQPHGYQAKFVRGNERFYVRDIEPALADELVALEERAPCGMGASVPQGALAYQQGVGSITAPVLVVFGTHDALFTPGAGRRARDAFTGSGDVQLLEVPEAGHMVMFERGAPTVLHRHLSDWLTARGF